MNDTLRKEMDDNATKDGWVHVHTAVLIAESHATARMIEELEAVKADATSPMTGGNWRATIDNRIAALKGLTDNEK